MSIELPKGPAIGIDLGTTYSCVAVFQHGRVEVIANDQGNRTTPSYVAFTDTERLIGDAAKDQVEQNPHNTVFDVKRLIGRNFNDVSVQEDMKHFPFSVVDENEKLNIEVEFKNQRIQFCLEELVAMILTKMKETAEAYLNAKVTDAVITVPAYFNDSQRQATKDAAAIAGLNVLRIINEPTAAAIAYGLGKKAQEEKNVMILDLGGGKLEVSIFTIDNGVFNVKSTSGNAHLGGEDFDSRLVNNMASKFNFKHGLNIFRDKRALRRLRTACEQAKQALSLPIRTIVHVPLLSNERNLNSTISQDFFENLCSDLFISILDPVKKALKDSKMNHADIAEVILVGGSTKIPKIQRLLANFFGDHKINTSINPDEAVAYGAAVLAAIINDPATQFFQKMLIFDVTPLTLGIECFSGVISPFINANSTIPASVTQQFTTCLDNQSKIRILVYQGDRPMIADNKLVGKFILDGIAIMKRGLPKIDVTFNIDVNGILNVTAKNRNGVENEITITKESGRLTQEQIDRMKRVAEWFQKEDQKHRAIANACNALDLYAYQSILAVSQPHIQGQIPNYYLQLVDDSVDAVMKWLETNKNLKLNEIKRKQSELERICNPIVTRICQ